MNLCLLTNLTVFLLMRIFTSCGFRLPYDSVAVDFDSAYVTLRRMEGRHCTAVEEGFLPDSGGAPGRGRHYAAVMMAHCHGNVVALGCGCCRSAGVQAECHSQEWLEELFSGPVGMNGGTQFLPRGGS